MALFLIFILCFIGIAIVMSGGGGSSGPHRDNSTDVSNHDDTNF